MEGAHSEKCRRMKRNLIKEVSREQGKRQAKSKCKEKTTAHPERKKTSKERKG
jgi:hypothetical protein